jgi:hypothetical protein
MDILQSTATRTQSAQPAHQYPPLAQETRANLPTPEAAFHLNRRPQTLRGWACNENGPLRPLRISGRLAWPTAELRRVLGVPA